MDVNYDYSQLRVALCSQFAVNTLFKGDGAHYANLSGKGRSCCASQGSLSIAAGSQIMLPIHFKPSGKAVN